MNILVYDIAAEYAGAMTILKKFYNEVIQHGDKSHTWYFVVSNGELEEQDNIQVIRVPWIKKSWIHRWVYDEFLARKLVEEYDIDLVFSMQNMPIKGAKCKQAVYLHQSLQFSPIKYSLFKKEERMLWIRQNVICNLMKHSLKDADAIIVQTKWMKDSTINWLKDKNKKIEVIAPDVNIKSCEENVERIEGLFFYPASDEIYKNHTAIIKACEILKQKNIPYRVLLTINADGSCYARKLYTEVENKGLNIEFVGLLEYEQIMKLYRTAVLVFPSCLESYGLPLLEARESEGMVLCSDLPFAHEILDGYSNAYFFNISDAKQLANYMEKCSGNQMEPKSNVKKEPTVIENDKKLVEFLMELWK